MSVVLTPMYPDQLNPSFAPGPRHALFAGFQPQRAVHRRRSVSPQCTAAPAALAGRKRARQAPANCDAPGAQHAAAKRPRTVPTLPAPSPGATTGATTGPASTLPTPAGPQARAQSITLPSLSDALRSVPGTAAGRKHDGRTRPPTVSLDYFDTYMPTDEHWRYGLLDSIRHLRPAFALDKYAYLDGAAARKTPPRARNPEHARRPQFDSRVSCKALPAFPQRKVNFPYESSYTYLDSAYLHDVAKFPEYLELARLLVLLSQPHAAPGPQPHQAQRRGASPGPPHRPPGEALLPLGPRLPPLALFAYATPDQSFECQQLAAHAAHAAHAPYAPYAPYAQHVATQRTHFVPITPPAVKDKSRLELMRSSPKASHGAARVCISCGSDQSPCWRPSWSTHAGQLCNSCGLRYKKTAARCLNTECKKIPAKGEWALMLSRGKSTFDDGERAYACLGCGAKVEARQ